MPEQSTPSARVSPRREPGKRVLRRGGLRLVPSLLALGLLALTGCESISETPGEETYLPPPSGTPVAYVRGSSIDEGGLFGSVHRGFVNMIDLRSVRDAADRWDKPIALSPGLHTIVAEYRYSNFMTRAYLHLDAKAGVNYELMIKNGREATTEGRLYSDFWIIDSSTGKSVTPTLRRQVSGGKTGTIFYNNK